MRLRLGKSFLRQYWFHGTGWCLLCFVPEGDEVHVSSASTNPTDSWDLKLDNAAGGILSKAAVVNS